jgi:hypothetical protein
LYISGVSYLNHRILFLEDYKCRGWDVSTGGPELEWRRKVRVLNMVTGTGVE